MFDEDEPGQLATTDSDGGLTFLAEETELLMEARMCEQRIKDELQRAMVSVVLPESRRIGRCLARVRDLNPPGRKGPGGAPSPFYAKVERITGWGKRSVQGYMSIAENYDRLMEYVADPPRGALPVTSLRAALAAISWMNGRKELTSGPAITVEAEAVPEPPPHPFEAEVRKLRGYDGGINQILRQGGLDGETRLRLEDARIALILAVQRLEALPTPEAEPTPALPPAAEPVEPAPPVEDLDEAPGRGELGRRYPRTEAGLADLDRDLQSKGPRLAEELRLPRKTIVQHRRRIVKALEGAAGSHAPA
jgi:hypothetical protein